ncbi:hypothetical protein FAF44_02680 [Nonomuraea sp. MG754425]|uniref:hypothetical protein n=1 Tax=Nonomuraea sp. MG754425 TaxID=2570319 RepID=UPI001F1FC0F3|nr:hypothetical protein [Nonomuraea sp. MG754425]MCF6467319.1 hypothetical protein [Nonomuraea sp. MG754425]
MTQVKGPALNTRQTERPHLTLVVSQPSEQTTSPSAPARIAIPYEMRDHLAQTVAAALEGLALAEADGVPEVTAAAAEDAAYPLNRLIDLFTVRYRTSPGRARSHAMRMVRARMGITPGRCWEQVSARDRGEEIKSLVQEGLSDEAIAQRLRLTVRTVQRHKQAAGLTFRRCLYDEWAPRILAHLGRFPGTEFSSTDLARVLLGEPSGRFSSALRRLEREGRTIAVAGIRDSGSPTVRTTRWRIASGREEGGQ